MRPTAARTNPVDFASGWRAASQCGSRSRRRSAESTASSSKTNNLTIEHALNVLRDQVELEVDPAFLTQRLQVCPVDGLLQQVEAKLLTTMGHHREAATIDRNAVAYLDFLCYTRRDDLELRAPISPVDPDDAADFFNQTGK